MTFIGWWSQWEELNFHEARRASWRILMTTTGFIIRWRSKSKISIFIFTLVSLLFVNINTDSKKSHIGQKKPCFLFIHGAFIHWLEQLTTSVGNAYFPSIYGNETKCTINNEYFICLFDFYGEVSMRNSINNMKQLFCSFIIIKVH